ncbi:alpha-L-arabinofuranosidase C-terminal domain-containing protein [Anaerosporobacter sp.]|uniref:alpha-L-arabinofuranosidase C-terminal domain-containing protein n=1 Tax=Anaerosporobacter sp. TaxID=1872529 RepID=UPI00286EE7E1|nr:alpha-L-arabinofuranosidase C-terminal domain-containing protein [Anaerosporobacter sp.]
MKESKTTIGGNIGMQNKEHSTNIKVHIDVDNKVSPMGDLFGLFFEDLNHAADGGLYAEMLRNRSFEFSPEDNESYTHLTGWSAVGEETDVALEVIEEEREDKKQHHYIRMKVNTAGCGMQNQGFNAGLNLQENQNYLLTCYAKNKDIKNENIENADENNTDKNNTDTSNTNVLTAGLYNKDNTLISEQEILLSEDWNKYEVVLSSSCTDHECSLRLTLPKAGEVYLDYVSLFPEETFCRRKNGLRKDIAQALADMKPKFMRFPGGCLVHCGTVDAEDRHSMYRWKKTIGEVEKRYPKRASWGYHQTLGLGFFEYFQFCEDIGAKPLPVIPAGFDPHTQIGAPLSEMQEWIDEALDLIEFANGDTSTTWGKIRSDMGHPESFNLEYLAIGNEEQGQGFFERYAIMHKAIREKNPDIKIINSAGPFCSGGDFEAGWKSARELKSDMIDEHYYQAPEWFVANHHRYDSYNPEDPKVFLGEYASEGNLWYNALTEASYMIGLERNCDKVALACYAPMLANVDYVNWRDANMIWYDNHQLLLTPSYYVQKLFMNHQGDDLLDIKIETDLPVEDWTPDGEMTVGKVTLKGIRSEVEYTNIKVATESGVEFATMEACSINAETPEVTVCEVNEKAYSISFQAKQVSEEGVGFLACFAEKENGNMMNVSFGGWNNANSAVNEIIDGKQICMCQYPFPVERNRVYDVKIIVNGRKIQVYADGVLYQDVERDHLLVEPLYCSSSIEKESGDVIVKVVNLKKQEQAFEAILSSTKTWNYTAYVMSGYERRDCNELGIDKVKPLEENGVAVEGRIQYKVPAESFIVFRLECEEKI